MEPLGLLLDQAGQILVPQKVAGLVANVKTSTTLSEQFATARVVEMRNQLLMSKKLGHCCMNDFTINPPILPCNNGSFWIILYYYLKY